MAKESSLQLFLFIDMFKKFIFLGIFHINITGGVGIKGYWLETIFLKTLCL